MEYVVKFRKSASVIWKKRKVIGHNYLKDIDKMVFHFSTQKLEEVPEWSKYHVVLGSDFFLAQKEHMEKETGVDIKLKGV